MRKSAMRMLKKSNPHSALAGTPAANRFLAKIISNPSPPHARYLRPAPSVVENVLAAKLAAE